ncbi:MAG: prepilin-type N-terminal cleavage/methylation domain-containing protein, partial [Planctomycetes bacterium]|nr:prepilin-type N-terminal cleavage/methylation domain-containing protein [Planctomycetota bacterium]
MHISVNRQKGPDMRQKRGFTLIELLVVIAIIAILLAILMPALRKAKEIAYGIVCLSNQKNLGIAWIMYSTENDSRLVGGSTYRSGDSRPTEHRWVERPLLDDIYDSTEAPEPQYSLETRHNGIRAGKLFTYTMDESVYHCPGDHNDRDPEPGAAFRSYAISGLMNGEDRDR